MIDILLTMAQTILLIDNREREFVRNYADIDRTHIQIAPLEVGDFQILHNETPVVIIERKTVSDLMASIHDGRYVEQKGRLLAVRQNAHPVRVVYILENAGQFDPRNKTVNGAVINTILRDQIPFFVTQNQEQTWDLILDIFNRISRDPEPYKRPITYAPSLAGQAFGLTKTEVAPRKRDNIDCFILQLSCIEGISTRTAQNIANEFKVGTINELCEKIKANGFANVKGVGPVSQQRILSSLGLKSPSS